MKGSLLLLGTLLVLAQYSVGNTETRRHKKCHDPKGRPGDTYYQGCKQFQCVKKKRRHFWEESFANSKCCLFKNSGYPVGSTMLSNMTSNSCVVASLKCEYVVGMPEPTIHIQNMCPECPTSVTPPTTALPYNSTLLYSDSDYDYYKVSVHNGSRLLAATIVSTCQAVGMEAVCPGPSSCSYTSRRCVVTPLSLDCNNPMYPLSKQLCGTTPTSCKSTSGLFSYMYSWSGGNACGAVGSRWCAYGSKYTSGSPTYFAYCAVANNGPDEMDTFSHINEEIMEDDSIQVADLHLEEDKKLY